MQNHLWSASKLKSIRELKDMSCYELAKHSGVSHVSIANIESGKTSPRADTIAKLAQALDVAFVIM